MEQRHHYSGIDYLRTVACMGIVMMHVQANSRYSISGFLYEKLIPSFTDFVFLFMMISAFGMCCGYLNPILNSQISMETFYVKRYRKIVPFFAVLVVLDEIMSPSKAALIEGVADITLLFGLFPNHISVIGVGWFLGLIFAFYLIFPFYCVLLQNKKRAWGAFTVSLILNYMCSIYFEVGRTNIVYCLCYLLAGGLIYLYRKELERFVENFQWVAIVFLSVSIVLYFAVGANTVTCLLTTAGILICALNPAQKGNKFISFFSSISMEVYLSHMVIFRMFEKLHWNTMFGNGWVQYIITVVVTIGGAIAFSVGVKWILNTVGKTLDRKRKDTR